MSKKPSLAAALHKASGKPEEIAVRSSSSPMPEDKPLALGRPPSRQGKRAVAGHFDPAVAKQLKLLAIQQDRTVQALLAEALNDCFLKYGQKPIA